jgi:hypothetical protein
MVIVVVGVALDRLQIELAGDLHLGLHPEPVDLDRRELPVHLAHRAGEVRRGQVPQHRLLRRPRRPVAEDLVQILDALLDDCFGLARVHLVGAHLVLEILDQVGAEDAPETAERHRQVQIQAVAHVLVQVVLGHQEHPEALEPAVAQGQLVARVVLAEAAGATGAGGEVDVLLVHRLDAELLRLLLEEVHEIAGGEAGRTALADVGGLAAGEQVRLRGDGQDLRAVAAVLQHRLQDALDAPVQASEQDRHRVALGAREGAGRVRPVVISRYGRHSVLHRGIDPARNREVAPSRSRAACGWSRRPCGPRRGPPRRQRDSRP